MYTLFIYLNAVVYIYKVSISVYSKITVLGELANFEHEICILCIIITCLWILGGETENFGGTFHPLTALK